MSDLAQSLPWGRDEAELVTELQAGSDAAFDWLVTYYHAGVYNLVYGILSDAADAADVTQEVFLRAFRGIRGFRRGSSLKTWLYRISVRQALNHRRWCWRHHRQQVSIDEEKDGKTLALDLRNSEATPFERLATQETQATVRRALAQVPVPFRSAVILRDLEGLSYEEIAEILDISVGTAKSRILRGRRRLKEILDPILHVPQSEAASVVTAPPREKKRSGRAPPTFSVFARSAQCHGGSRDGLRMDKGKRWSAMNCREVERRLAGYLDGAINSREHARVREHLDSCGNCREQLEGYRRLSVCLANVEAAAPPAHLVARIRVDASQARSFAPYLRRTWARTAMIFENLLQPVAIPATGGVLTALVVFVLVVQNILVGVPLGGVAVPGDLPLNLVQPARLESLAPFPAPRRDRTRWPSRRAACGSDAQRAGPGGFLQDSFGSQ